jgi:SpoVK/Ycf46/Vps4 family AAA+-type ATPase
MTQERIEGLRQALEHAPGNHALRLMLAELFAEGRRFAEASGEYARMLEAGALSPTHLLAAGRAAVSGERWDELERVLAAARAASIVEGLGELEAARERALRKQGVLRLAPRGASVPEGAPASADVEEPTHTFTDVGGLEEVKKVIHRMIILPFQRPELYAKYGKKAGGGVLLYGPPGCGKTLLARATAGECRLPFVNIRIENILDPYLGVSERNLHDAFEEARARRPCVVFLDELDGLAYARGKHHGSAARTVVDQLLQELDAIGADNEKLMILAATNAPWDVDEALKRPGRFDRVVFVPPPDEEGRLAILELKLQGRQATGVDARKLAKDTGLFSGADLHGLVERAVDAVIDEALASGREPPLGMSHLIEARGSIRASTLDWLGRARNYVEFANDSERYADVAKFLKTREAKAYKAWEP